MNLGKCCVCLDEAIGKRAPVDVDALADAIVLAPFVIGTQTGPLAVPMGMCLRHRQSMLASNGQRKLIVSLWKISAA